MSRLPTGVLSLWIDTTDSGLHPWLGSPQSRCVRPNWVNNSGVFLSFQYCFIWLCLAIFVHVRQDVERHVVGHLGYDICQNFNWYQSRHPVLFLGEILGKILSGHGQGWRFVLKSCLNLKKFVWLWEWSLEVEDGLFVAGSSMFLEVWCFDEELLCCSCDRFVLFSNLWYLGVTWSIVLGLICDTWRF